jgi:hypothetical protein
MEKICKICNKSFVIGKSRQINCSKNCSNIYNLEMGKIRKRERAKIIGWRVPKYEKCLHCGSIFRKMNCAKTCSKKCSKMMKNANARKRNKNIEIREKRRVFMRLYRYKNKEKMRAYYKKRYANPIMREKRKESDREYYQKTKIQRAIYRYKRKKEIAKYRSEYRKRPQFISWRKNWDQKNAKLKNDMKLFSFMSILSRVNKGVA